MVKDRWFIMYNVCLGIWGTPFIPSKGFKCPNTCILHEIKTIKPKKSSKKEKNGRKDQK
ncbi:MAG: hypothetical protein PHX21_13880 [bacterium]|nr:hypothetical protein [bacterium]